MNIGSARIGKRDWYRRGGFTNSRCWRRQPANRGWLYYYRYD